MLQEIGELFVISFLEKVYYCLKNVRSRKKKRKQIIGDQRNMRGY